MVSNMSSKEPNRVIDLGELGSLQKKVLFFLAENPDKHKQAIQQGIRYPPEQYGSVLKAANALENSGYIKSIRVVSEKNVEIKTYSCTDTGVFYTLCKNPDADVVRVLDAHKSRSDVFNSFRSLYDVWGHDTFARFFRNVSDFFPMMQREGIERAVTFLLVKFAMDAESLDLKTRKKNAKAVLKQFPNTRKLMKEWSDTIKELL